MNYLFLLLVPTSRCFLHHERLYLRSIKQSVAKYRVYDVRVSVDEDPGAKSDPSLISSALKKATRRRVKSLVNGKLVSVDRVVRKSLDTRHKPRWVYVVEASLAGAIKERKGCLEGVPISPVLSNRTRKTVNPYKKKVIVVGSGPAGLLCARELAARGIQVTLLERGEPVERRGGDIGKLIHRKQLDLDSNFCFGEGGAGTWSDGKLTTRIGRNEEMARKLLQVFVDHGASPSILLSGAPHLGTDALVRILRSLRHELIEKFQVDIHFRTRVVAFCVENSCITGCLTEDGLRYNADALVVATGHSADDIYTALADAGALLKPKGIAVGYRIEHPQALINAITYGPALARRVHTGKKRTDTANTDFLNAKYTPLPENNDLTSKSLLPVPGYRLAANGVGSTDSSRSAYSFCCCPGGQVVPASTSPDLVVVNGMSFSRRDSVFANAALVATVDPDDPLLDAYRKQHGALAALHFQRDAERAAARLGGGSLVAPVSRVTDFLQENRKHRIHASITSSYRLGVKEAPVRDCYPEAIHEALAAALLDNFEASMPGFICPEAILHGVETRTSAPVQIQRDKESLEAIGVINLFPCGEGAGHAGGIVSAAVDGMRIADAVTKKLTRKKDSK